MKDPDEALTDFIIRWGGLAALAVICFFLTSKVIGFLGNWWLS